MSGCLLAAIAVLIPLSPAGAQRSELTLEAGLFNGTLGYAGHTTPRMLVGVEGGFGFPQMNLTLHPGENAAAGRPEFAEILQLGVFARAKLSDRSEIDAGVRVSAADLWPCQASDCWPEVFYGGYVQPMIGWRRIRLGARLTAGWIAEGDEGTSEGRTFTVGVAPVLVRVTISR